MHDITGSLSGEAAVVEAAKLKAIGQRNLVSAEVETRRRRGRELQALIDERNAELARVSAECDSLVKLEGAQREAIGRLSNREPPGF